MYFYRLSDDDSHQINAIPVDIRWQLLILIISSAFY